MPGVTFFCVFMRPETKRQGVVTTPLGRTRVNVTDNLKSYTLNPAEYACTSKRDVLARRCNNKKNVLTSLPTTNCVQRLTIAFPKCTWQLSGNLLSVPSTVTNSLTAHNWQKRKSIFLTCSCHKIHRVVHGFSMKWAKVPHCAKFSFYFLCFWKALKCHIWHLCHHLRKAGVEAVGLKSFNYTLRIMILWICEIWGDFVKNSFFCQ